MVGVAWTTGAVGVDNGVVRVYDIIISYYRHYYYCYYVCGAGASSVGEVAAAVL